MDRHRDFSLCPGKEAIGEFPFVRGQPKAYIEGVSTRGVTRRGKGSNAAFPSAVANDRRDGKRKKKKGKPLDKIKV